MDRGILVGNRLCAKKLEDAKQARHLEKLNRMRPGIDNKLPTSASLTHLKSNLKRDQLNFDNHTEIDRANRILLQRMSDIIQKPSEVSCLIPGKKESRSLNRESRRKEHQRITNENLSIMKRIQKAQATYDHIIWEHDYRKTREYMKNSCELPVVLGQSNSDLLSLTSEEHPSPEVELTEQVNLEEGASSSLAARSEFRNIAKDGRRIGETFYLIEVSTNRTGGLLVTAFSGQEEDGNELELVLDKDQHEYIVNCFNGDYTKLIDKIRIRNGRISLLPF